MSLTNIDSCFREDSVQYFLGVSILGILAVLFGRAPNLFALSFL
jgi:hypothetical protein